LAGVSSLLVAVNFMSTTFSTKPKKHKTLTNPAICMIAVTVLLPLQSLPVLAGAITVLLTDRNLIIIIIIILLGTVFEL
jgi:cytochrome c oxidase subunit 1